MSFRQVVAGKKAVGEKVSQSPHPKTSGASPLSSHMSNNCGGANDETSLSKTNPLNPAKNSITEFTQGIFKSEFSRLHGQLAQDFTKILEGHCFYLREFLCERLDFAILQSLTSDIDAKAKESGPEGTGMINWSRHFKYENPDFSPTFQKVLSRLSQYFDVEIHATRLNFYPDATSWKPFHHDSHAYGAKGIKEDFTMVCPHHVI